jgi:hypothetical protein
MSTENDVRAAAGKLYDAIEAAKAEGMFVAWPSNHKGLPEIAISEVKPIPPPLATPRPEAPVPEPVRVPAPESSFGKIAK